MRVHAAARSYLHGATPGRAMCDVAHRPEMQVHRSWWVAQHAVRGWPQDGRATSPVLGIGRVAPVARQRVASLRAAGWLRPAARIVPAMALARRLSPRRCGVG